MKQIAAEDIQTGETYFLTETSTEKRHGARFWGKILAIDLPFVVIKTDFGEKIPVKASDFEIHQPSAEFLAAIN